MRRILIIVFYLSSGFQILSAQVSEDLGERVRALLIITGVKSPQIFGPGRPWSKKSKAEIAQILGVEFLETRD